MGWISGANKMLHHWCHQFFDSRQRISMNMNKVDSHPWSMMTPWSKCGSTFRKTAAVWLRNFVSILVMVLWSCIWKSSYKVRIFPVAKMCRWVSKNPRQQTSKEQKIYPMVWQMLHLPCFLCWVATQRLLYLLQ